MQTFLFYSFSAFLILSALCVISTRQTIHSLFFLILAFLNAAVLFLMIGAEFLSMIMLVVYIGAVAVLFLFVVMMLDRQVQSETTISTPFSRRYQLLAGMVAGLFILELLFIGATWSLPPLLSPGLDAEQEVLPNTHALGCLLYTDYFLNFQIAGLILLVAMVGAIVLTLPQRERSTRQKPPHPSKRSPHQTVSLEKVGFRQGVKTLWKN